MFIKKDKVYASPGKFLKETTTGIISLQSKGKLQDFTEVTPKIPYRVRHGYLSLMDNQFSLEIKNLNYDQIKTKMIKIRYSEDSQIALILNKDLSEEDLDYYNKMQEWREFASEVARFATQNS